jgi:hypothetical protein
MGDQCHAEDCRSELVDFVERFGDFDTAALAAAAGMDLGLDHPYLAAELACRRIRVGHGEARDSAGCRDAVFAEYLFSLIFVNIHANLASRVEIVENHGRARPSRRDRRHIAMV